MAKRLRTYTAHIEADTIPDFFERRFRDKSHLLMGISRPGHRDLLYPLHRLGFSACGKLFSSLFGFDYTAAMIVSAAVIIIYTASGGFPAASTTDFIQSIIMTIALIVIVCPGVSNAGGFDAVSAYATSLPGYISVTSMHDAASGAAVSYGGVITTISTLAWGLGYLECPTSCPFHGHRKPEKIKLSRRVATIWVFIAMAVAIFIGVIALCLSHVGIIGTLEDPERPSSSLLSSWLSSASCLLCWPAW